MATHRNAVVERHCARIVSLVPGAEVELTGSASVPGLSADDLDLVVLVPDVACSAELLRDVYPPLNEDEWRDDWAAFRDPGPPQVDVVVTREGTKGDAHHRLAWRLLAERPDLLEEYRELKASRIDLERRKAAFFERLIGLLG